MFGYDDENDSDDIDYGFHNGMNEYGDYGFDPSSLYHGGEDDMAFHMHMMAMLEDSSYEEDSSIDSLNLQNSSYFDWEETRMKDSYLLQFRPLVPVMGIRKETRLTSVAGAEWSKIVRMENMKGSWLESRTAVRYQDLANLSQKVASLLTAWKLRMKQCEGDWSKAQTNILLEHRKVAELIKLPELDEEKISELPFSEARMRWWQFLATKETDMSVEDRVRYSVGRGMVVFGSESSFDQIVQEVSGVKILVQNFVIGVLASNLPGPLPYPVLLSVTKLMLSSCGGRMFGWASKNKASQLVESRYVNRVYLAMLDIYTVMREIMFKHAGETASLNFPSKFAFLLSTLARNFSLLQSFHQLLRHEEPKAERIFFKEFKELKLKIEPSRQPGLAIRQRIARNRILVSGNHVFIIHGGRLKEDTMDEYKGLVIAVHHLVTGDLIKEFTAVPQSLLADHKYTLSTPVGVSGDFLVVSLSEGHQYGPLSVPGSDMVFIINWVKEKLVSSKMFLHSLQFDAAEMQMREENCSDGMNPGDDDDDDSMNSSYYDEDMVLSALGVCLTEKDGNLFLLHSEVVLPEMEYEAELEHWGHHVRIFGLEGNRLVEELHDVRILAVLAGLVIYEETSDGRSNKESQGVFTEFSEVDVIVKWLDLVLGKEICQESFQETPRPVYSIARPYNERLVLQYQPGKDVVDIYKVDDSGTVAPRQQVVFPALASVWYREAGLKIGLVDEDLLSFRHSVISPSLNTGITRCVLAKAGCTELLAEMFVPNAVDYDDENKTNGCYLANPADKIIQDGTRIVLLRGGDGVTDRDFMMTIQQYEFKTPVVEVIKWDEEIAKHIFEKMEAGKIESKRNEMILSVLSKNGLRVAGTLVNWCGSFGFLKLDDHPDTPNVFIHISEISKPRPFLTAGVGLEVRLKQDLRENRVQAVEGRVLYA